MPTTEVSTWTLEECSDYCTEAQDSYSERHAEAGSSAFMLYGNAGDANSVAYAVVPPLTDDPLYCEAKARLDADAAAHRPLRVIHSDPSDLPF